MKRDTKDAQKKLITNVNEKKAATTELAELADDSELYGMIFQNTALNSAFKLNDKRNTKRNYNRELVVKVDAVTAITKAAHLGLPEAVMLTYVTEKFNQLSNHDNNQTFSFTLKEYMKDRGLKDPKSARKSIRKTLDAIGKSTFSYSGGNGNQYNKDFGTHGVLEYDYFSGQGKIVITFSQFYFDLLINGSMPMPNYRIMYRLHPTKDATAIYVLRALENNKRINKPKNINKSKKNNKAQVAAPERGDRIKVSTLLHEIPSLSSYDEIKKGTDRHTYDRLILPVFKAVERLADPTDPYRAINRYSFMSADNKPLSYDNIDFETFSNAYLVIEEWHKYPDDLLKKWSETQRKSKAKNKQKSKTK